jgi:hypothetical protein
MKKTILIALLAVLCLSAKAQTIQIPVIDGIYQYQEVVNLDSNIYKKGNLYNNSKLYFVDSYKSAKDVIQYDDKDQGKVIGKGFFSISTNQKYNLMFTGNIKWDVYYTIEIFCKNGRYRYRIYDIYINDFETAENGQSRSMESVPVSNLSSLRKESWYKKGVDKLSLDMPAEFVSSITTLKSYMAKTDISKKDDF